PLSHVNQGEFPRTVALPPQHTEIIHLHADRRALWRQFILGFKFAPLACRAVRDLNVFVLGNVAQHLETRIIGTTFLIVSLDRVLPHDRRFSWHETHRILRKNVYQSFRILGQCYCNVFLVKFIYPRPVGTISCGRHSISSEVARAEACEKRHDHYNGTLFHRASSAPSFVMAPERLSTVRRLPSVAFRLGNRTAIEIEFVYTR